MSNHPYDDEVLDQQLDIIAEDPDAAVDSGLFSQASKERVNWAVWRIGRINAEIARSELLYITQLRRLDDWIEGERQRAERAKSFLEGICAVYHRVLLAEDKRAKTVRLPAGEIVARKDQDSWDIDVAKVVAWAEQNGRDDLIRRPDPQVDRNAVKKLFTPDEADRSAPGARVLDPVSGELVPGVRVTKGEIRYCVKPHAEVDQ